MTSAPEVENRESTINEADAQDQTHPEQLNQPLTVPETEDGPIQRRRSARELLSSPFSKPDLEASDAITSLQITSPLDRLSIHPAWRVIFGSSVAGLVGFSLGASHGATLAGYRFRAENAHRLPRSQKGWFFYHKTKNYHAALGGVKEGLKMSAKLGIWAGVFLLAEVAVDGLRREEGKDALGSVVAAVGTSGVWSVWNRFPMHTCARTTRIGLGAGLGYGLVQDALGVARGRKIGYIESIKRVFGHSDHNDDLAQGN